NLFVYLCPHPTTPAIYTLSLHDALPIFPLQLSLALTPPNTSGTAARQFVPALALLGAGQITAGAVSSVTVKVVVQVALLVAASRSEEHTSELQSRENLVCRLLLEKKTTP